MSVIGNPPTQDNGTITTGGTSQALFGGYQPVNGYSVQNPDAANDLWIGEGIPAVVNGAGCYKASANGGGYETPSHHAFKVNGPINITSAATGAKYTARCW